MRPTTIHASIAAACLALAAGAAAAPQQDTGSPVNHTQAQREEAPPGAQDDIAELSLEQLSDIVITSVSRQEERLGNAAASIYIVGGSEIRRSGARTLPEALRLAPNLQVARVDARSYAITARGFNSLQSNKLLVLIDGRNVYTPLFSGVFWEAQDVLMEDIERIEVISGPGSTIWGANAVNGVINVITKSAKDTQGGLLTAGVSSSERDGTVRYGGTLPNGGHYRGYARYIDADDADRTSGSTTPTGYKRKQAGFRADWDRPGGGFTVSGDAYDGELPQNATRPITISGANLVTRFTRRFADDASLRLQLVLDHTERNQPSAINERLDTIELEAQHSMRLGRGHSVTWGAGYRYARERLESGRAYTFLPGDLTMHWASLFAQDEIALRDDVRLTLGMKAEHNHYTGLEYLPNARLAWTPDSRQLLWASVTRTVRAPSRFDRDLYAPVRPFPVGGVLRYASGGGPDFQSETARVAELGYRIQPTAAVSYSATLFVADYDRLRTQEPNLRGPAYSGLSEVRNMGYGNTRGVEMWARWHVTDRWRLNGGLTVQRVRTGLRPGSQDPSGTNGLVTADPNHYWQLRSSHDLPANMQLDWTLRYVGALPRPVVPSYHELDLQWMWRPRPNIDVALIGQNLLHSSHPEFGAATNRSVFERAAVLKLTVRF